jgi:hypothetical protein
LLRRTVHILVALAPAYFLIPETVPGIDLKRWVLLVVFFAGVALFESFRLWRGVSFLGLRPHEKKAIASFAWAAAGITLALWIFPEEIATAVLIGMALVDPLLGELRRRGYGSLTAQGTSVVVYFAICAISLFAWDVPALHVLLLSVPGSVVAVASEWKKVPYIDDDFLMIVVPGALMSALSLVL